MLKEIYSPAFMDDGKIREPIPFKSGLNTVLGSSNAKNSIGKTTFLLAIDFAFGGNDYVQKNDDMINNVEPHFIYFVFEFSGKPYYFARSTDDYMFVYKTDSNRHLLSKMSVKDYTDFLSTMYKMNDLGATFRELVSGTFRIYGRNNLDEIHPLKAYAGDTAENGIKRTLQLYGYFKSLIDLETRKNKSLDEKNAYKAAHKHDFIHGVTRQEDYRNNISKIEELRTQKEELANESSQDLLEMDSFQAERLSEIMTSIAKVRRERNRLVRKIESMKLDTEIPKTSLKSGFDDLVEFFPDADIKHIEDIEKFHRSIGAILKQQYSDEVKQIEASISILESRLEVLNIQKNEISHAKGINKLVLDKYSELDRELSSLENSNRYYDHLHELEDVCKEYEKSYNEALANQTAELSYEINTALEQLNSMVCGPDVQAPKLTITNPKNYVYKIKQDSGTGARTRAMLLLDYVALEKTPLPAVAEDSVSIKQIEDKSLLNILELFNSSEKQCFIAIDKANSYSSGHGVPSILYETRVIELSEGHELYGRAWNKKMR